MIQRLIVCILVTGLLSCSTNTEMKYASFEDYPVYPDENLWLDYSPERTVFKLWSPTAKEVALNIYEKGDEWKKGDEVGLLNLIQMRKVKEGLWQTTVQGDQNGNYYTFQTKHDKAWLEETPGIYAKAVGVNGKRAMILDFSTTNPEGWEEDRGPTLNTPNEAIIYELHVRDLTTHQNSGSSHQGKYLGLIESGTTGPDGVKTGIDHIKELGITHVHLLPSYDHYSIDETQLDVPQFNWGYDPQNYNVPEGSYSSDPYNADVRIKEFKQMVKGFHDAGIGVILDVVYNHTGINEGSNFNLELPGYYYRFKDDGSYSDASGCGNETASERTMMRKFIVESVAYWAEEYHLDGFRFDLMGIHDQETMNQVAAKLKEINPSIFVYGEGWTAGDSPLDEGQRALKKSTNRLVNVTAFSDDIRDGLKGSVFDDKSTGFVSGAENTEESVKFGVVGSIRHPDIDYKAVNYSDAPWANEPWQAISYVSCHDNHTLFDKLSISREDANREELIKMHQLANAVVLTSQGIPFLHAGVELMRTKGGEHNSYKSPDSVNQFDWTWKVKNKEVFDYYRSLIALRKNHPSFYMPHADMVRNHLSFNEVKPGLVSYIISNPEVTDEWKEIFVVYNGRDQDQTVPVSGRWTLAVSGSIINEEGIRQISGSVTVPATSMMVAFRK